MANRNVSQLPENTDPQESDWLLGASGNSPSVLQKMAVGSIKPEMPTVPTKTSDLTNDSGFINVEPWGGLFETISQKTYHQFTPDRLYKIKSLRVKSLSGTCTWDIRVNNISVPGMSNIAVSSTEQFIVLNPEYSIEEGQSFEIVCTSTDVSAENIGFTFMLGIG